MQILELLLARRLRFLDRINGLHCGICSRLWQFFSWKCHSPFGFNRGGIPITTCIEVSV